MKYLCIQDRIDEGLARLAQVTTDRKSRHVSNQDLMDRANRLLSKIEAFDIESHINQPSALERAIARFEKTQ